jgi:hypothetical protein
MGSMASPSRTGGRKIIIGGGAGMIVWTVFGIAQSVYGWLGGVWYCSKLYYTVLGYMNRALPTYTTNSCGDAPILLLACPENLLLVELW